MTCLHVVRIEVEVHCARYIIVDSDKAKRIFCVGIIRIRSPSSAKRVMVPGGIADSSVSIQPQRCRLCVQSWRSQFHLNSAWKWKQNFAKKCWQNFFNIISISPSPPGRWKYLGSKAVWWCWGEESHSRRLPQSGLEPISRNQHFKSSGSSKLNHLLLREDWSSTILSCCQTWAIFYRYLLKMGKFKFETLFVTTRTCGGKQSKTE